MSKEALAFQNNNSKKTVGKLELVQTAGTPPSATETRKLVSREEFEADLPRLRTVLASLFRRRYFNTVKNFASPTEVMDDLIQDTLLKASTKFDSFKQNSSPETWVIRIFMNGFFDYLRKVNTKNVSLEGLRYGKEEDHMGFDVTYKNPEKDLIQKEKEESIEKIRIKFYKAIHKLPEMQRQVLELDLQGLRMRATAEILGTTEEKVKNLLYRVRRALEKDFDLPKLTLGSNLMVRRKTKDHKNIKLVN